MYQQTRLSDHTAVGSPGPLPYCVANWSDAEVSDLDAMGLDHAFGLAGMGFWPVDVATPTFDPTSQVLIQPTACDSVDIETKRWSATATVRSMTDDEYSAANPVPVQVTNYQARVVLLQAGLFNQVDAMLRSADMSNVSNAIALQAWDYANVYIRISPFITAMQAVLKLTDRQVDDMFRKASMIS